MAEHSFQEVMRQWVRARKATKCRDEENSVLAVYPLEAYDDTLIADIEKHVMQWAAENPEPVYPSWYAWLANMNVVPIELLPDQAVMVTDIGLLKKIPADIAEKLGIEPKETDYGI